MLRNILLIIPILVTTLIVPIFSYCSKGCKCNDASVAICNTLNLEPFGRHIFSLKIVNPKAPLILKGQPFNIRGLENVNAISIDNATILEIDKTAFTGIPLLSSFNIVNSNITSIKDPFAFTTATNLRVLSISNSTLANFEFVKSSTIQEFNLSGCKLTALTKSTFGNLPLLSYINLANNNISIVDPSTFAHLLYLEEINLSNNNITSLDSDIFRSNTELVTLDLSNNPLKNFDVNILSDLEKLVLRSFKLENFNENLTKDLSLLSYLDLSDNKVNISDTAFIKMEDLEYIDLSNNRLTVLHSDIFKFNYKLQKVILDNNNFSIIPKLKCHYDSFEIYYFSCRHCGINFLPIDTFKQLPAIVILNLDNNHLNGINLTAIQYLPSLIELNLSYNNITVLNPHSFMKTSGLEKLNLAGNPITTLDANLFHHTRSLKSLDLSFCKIRQLWKRPIKGKMASLTQLYLANNSITSIAPVDLQVTPALQVFNIVNNSLKCDQALRDSINWLTEHQVSPGSDMPTWKTHEPVTIVKGITFIFSNNKKTSWRHLASEQCLGDKLFGDEEVKIETILPEDDDDDDEAMIDEYDDNYEYFDSDEDDASAGHLDDFDKKVEKEEQILQEDAARIDIAERANRYRKGVHSQYSFLWPTLVFIFTALTVLVIAANIMLLLLKSKVIPRHVNLPHIKIPQWNTNGKLKKHSGSVYQPLSEDLSGPCTPIIIRKEQVPTHHSMPKSVV